jgi:hypothetical protein
MPQAVRTEHMQIIQPIPVRHAQPAVQAALLQVAVTLVKHLSHSIITRASPFVQMVLLRVGKIACSAP